MSQRSDTTFADLLLARGEDERPALRCDDVTWTWRELVSQALARAAIMRSLRRADRPFHVGVLLENTPEYVAWLYGAAFARSAVVGINVTRRGEALAHDVRHTDCQLLVTDRAGAELLAGLDLGLDPDGVLRVDSPEHRDRLATAMAQADDEIEPARSDDLLLLLFTSGSTGAPKAVVCTNGRLAAVAAGAVSSLTVTGDDVHYQSMPMFHGNAIMANLAPAVVTGACVAMRPRFSASKFLADVRRYGATYFNYVGRSLAYVLATPEAPDDADNPLRLGFGTEASLRDREEFERRFGCTLVERYGSSEGVISTHRPPGTPPASIGRPQVRPGSDVAVVDPDNRSVCPPAEFDAHGRLVNGDVAIGEIVDRGGPGAFEGYYRNDEATRARLRDGWYWTGDLAFADADGFLYFAGRNSDWLRVDSENFAAAPVEAILARHPDYVMVAVYAVPDPRTGDQVMAAVEPRAGTGFDAAGFGSFVAAQADLGTKWAPRFVRVVAAMPLTATNKVDKVPLRRDGWATDDPVFWRPGPGFDYRLLTAADREGLREAFARHGREHLLGTPGS